MITNYNDLPLGAYLDIVAISDDDTREANDKNLAILSILTGQSEDDLLNLLIGEFSLLMQKAAFLSEPLPRKDKPEKSYHLGPFTLDVMADVAKMTAGQYIDFQTFAASNDIAGMLSTILLPHGHTYGEGYDPADVRASILAQLPIVEANALAAFFFEKMRAFNQGFANLFGLEATQGDAPDEEDDEDNPAARFGKKWGWIYQVDQVAECQRVSWDNVMAKNIVEFLNTLCYLRDKQQSLKR